MKTVPFLAIVSFGIASNEVTPLILPQLREIIKEATLEDAIHFVHIGSDINVDKWETAARLSVLAERKPDRVVVVASHVLEVGQAKVLETTMRFVARFNASVVHGVYIDANQKAVWF